VLLKEEEAGESRHENEDYEPHAECIGGARRERY
jgi:hypothetical protein